MSCINPQEIKVSTKYKGIQYIKVDCRHCVNCMIKRQSQIEFLARKELLEVYKSGRSASFVTLTYDDNHLPVNSEGFFTLNRKDVQNWLKNMRRQMDYYKEKIPFKVLYCGEYGDGSHSTTKSGISTHRPHYHLVFLGLSTSQVRKYTRKLWKNGICDIGELSFGGIRYLCKYMSKALPDKDVKTFRELVNVQNPFFYHSVGLGKKWIDEHLDKIVEDDFTFVLNGKRMLFPASVIRYVAWHTNTNYKPLIIKFLQNEVEPLALAKNQTISEYDEEKSYEHYQTMIRVLRSNGTPINVQSLSKKWAHPYHCIDREPLDKVFAALQN